MAPVIISLISYLCFFIKNFHRNILLTAYSHNWIIVFLLGFQWWLIKVEERGVRALAFRHTWVLRIADLESQVCSNKPNEWEQNWHWYFNAIIFSQQSYLTRINFHFMFIFLNLTSASYAHQNKLCTSLLCIKLLATCITNGLAEKISQMV